LSFGARACLVAGGAMTAEWTPDHGASAERTRLAWRRTGLSAGAVALLAVRPAFAPHPSAVNVLVTAAAMAGWAALTALAYRRARGLAARPPRPGRRTIAAYALITVGFAVLGGLVVLL
jgi:uncharacterized membrane protein YidH (DUF202 family)